MEARGGKVQLIMLGYKTGTLLAMVAKWNINCLATKTSVASWLQSNLRPVRTIQDDIYNFIWFFEDCVATTHVALAMCGGLWELQLSSLSALTLMEAQLLTFK